MADIDKKPETQEQKPPEQVPPSNSGEGATGVDEGDHAEEQLAGFGGADDDGEEQSENGTQELSVEGEDGSEGSDPEPGKENQGKDGKTEGEGAEKQDPPPEGDESVTPDKEGADGKEPEPGKPEDKKAFRAQVTKIAKERFKAETGQDYDPFDEEHQATLMSIHSEVMQEVREKAKEIKTADEAAAEAAKKVGAILPKKELQDFADEMFMDLPTRKSDKIKRDLAKGDYSSMIEFCQNAAKEFEARKKAGDKVNKFKGNKAPNPPVLEGAGGRGEAGGASDDSMDQLAGFGLA